jgi:arylsulfatase A-like enzyme
VVALVFLSGCETPPSQPASAEQAPNVVIILTDDQGYQDVGVYGAEGYATPNLDQMAAEGMRFTSFYMAASACTPSRAALMTGSYPTRVGIPGVLMPGSTVGLNPEEVTIAELVKEEGYATAAVGKWHLGDHPKFLPTNHGFDHYFGIPYSNDMSPDPANNPRERARRHPPLPLLEDTTVIEREPDQSQLTRRYTERAVEFIEQQQDNPFFLYLAHTFPHVPLYASEQFRESTEQGRYGDVIREIDWSTGRIMNTLERLDLDEDTIVIFTSDNGPWLIFGDHAGKAGPLREGKGTSFEGGHRVPCIVRWPGEIPAGTVSDEMVTVMDFLPTVANLVGAELPDDRVIDGYDIWPILSGATNAVSPYERFFFYRGGQLQAVRSGSWKLHIPHGYRSVVGGEIAHGGTPGNYARNEIGRALYNLTRDAGETNNVADEHPETVDRLRGYIEEARESIGDRATDTPGQDARPPGRVEEPWQVQVNVDSPW